MKSKLKYLNWVLFFGYFTSMQPWFFYGTWVKTPVYAFFTLTLLLPCFGIKSLMDKSSLYKNRTQLFYLCIALLLLHMSMGLNATLGIMPTLVVIYFLFSLKSEIKVEILSFITKKMSILVGISLIVHVLYLVTDLPCGSFYPPDGSYGKGFDLQYLNIVSSWMPYKRFQSIFIEPGHLIVGIFPLLLINKFNIRNKYVAILFLALLFSLSLAGYLYSIIALVYLSLSRGKIKQCLISVGFSAILIGGIYYYMSSHEDSALTKAIAERLVFEDGSIAGDNRVTDFVDQIYEKVISSNDIFWGTHMYDRAMVGEGINGYKVIVIRCGIILLLFLAVAYLMQYRNSKSRDSFFLILMLLLMNSQNFYPYWICTLIILLAGPYYINGNYRNEKNCILLHK